MTFHSKRCKAEFRGSRAVWMRRGWSSWQGGQSWLLNTEQLMGQTWWVGGRVVDICDRGREGISRFFSLFFSLSLSFLLFLAVFRSREEREHQRMLPMDPPCCNVDQNRVRIGVKTSNPGWRFVHFQSPKSHNVPVCPTQVCDISMKTCSVHGGGGCIGLRWAHRAKLAPSEGPQCCLDG